jgi:sulfoxide reductase heme-binding subunit YedZ
VSIIDRNHPRFPIIRAVVHFLGWFPILWLVFLYFTGKLSVNPIQDLEQRLGDLAAYFLVSTLACTPLSILTGWREPLKRRQALGLYSFLYACLHGLVFIGLDYSFNLSWIAGILLQKPFAIAGMITFIFLLPLAVTSLKSLRKKMGKTWVWLHRLVYVAAILVILHFSWARKGNLITLSGNILQPALLGLLVIFLLMVRVPKIRQWINNMLHG